MQATAPAQAASPKVHGNGSANAHPLCVWRRALKTLQAGLGVGPAASHHQQQLPSGRGQILAAQRNSLGRAAKQRKAGQRKAKGQRR